MLAAEQTSPSASLASAQRSVLRLLTCGSVDDGKSTLIGRLLFDCKAIPEDQLAVLERDSKRIGTTGGKIDFALLVDGLETERQQGITIDVAYRYFRTDKRAFVIADTPGHEQYTRNMATGASTASLAILLVDARKGLLTQTKRHSRICALLGVKHIVVAVNKLDLMDFSQEVFQAIEDEYAEFAGGFGFSSIQAIPLCAVDGDNVATSSARTPWYTGPALLEYLESVDITADSHASPFRFPVQWVNRPHLDFRGFAGTVASGSVRPGDPVMVAGSRRQSTVDRLITFDGDLTEAGAGDAVHVTLKDEVDIARGDVLVRPGETMPAVADQFAAHVVWMGHEPLLPGRSYLLRAGYQEVPAAVTSLRYKYDINSHEHLAARQLELNEIGLCHISSVMPLVFDPYTQSREMGAFIVVDRATNDTVGAGMIVHALRRADNIHAQDLTVTKTARGRLKSHKPALLWFTGLSGAGKSTIANLVEQALHGAGVHTYLLDGDNLRLGLNRDLGFTEADRVENIRRVGEVAKLFVDAGLVVLCSFISPFAAERDAVRNLVSEGEFVEIFVDASLDACRQRDPKGLYRKADAGEIRNFTGVDSPYEPPASPELRLDTESSSPEQLASEVVRWLKEQRYV
ncbi:MAG TPA: sulfate adenylyltransferase subunit CysN [Microvirga sp.]|jgi:bifunctional enzyme CysN/CysC|nr:sulfate adenylyltransferase subunit CysN [Microvirga sp.]